MIVIADSDNWSTEVPALTVSLRGLADCVVEVATLDHGLHSGLWGGVVPDALSVLVRLLASLHDDDGNVAVAGCTKARPPTSDYPPERVRADTGLLDGVARDRLRLGAAAAVGQAGDHRHRHRHHDHRGVVEHADPARARQGQHAGGARR